MRSILVAPTRLPAHSAAHGAAGGRLMARSRSRCHTAGPHCRAARPCADSNTCIINSMSRKPSSVADREHGRRLGLLIAAGRMDRQQSAPDLAQEAMVAIDTVRSLENGRVAMPAFLTIARLA